MKTKKILLSGVLCVLGLTICAQDKAAWRNKKCAVSLTYDDALFVHLDNVVPALDSAGLKGTFYLTGYSPAVSGRLSDWKRAAGKGHELGNHTLFHPCTGRIPGREWVNADYDMSAYTVQRMVDEIRMNNTLLKAIDGKTKRTYAYPCGDMKIGDVYYLDKVKDDFVAARGVSAEMKKITGIDLYNIGAYGVNGQSGEQMIEWVKKAMENNTLLVFLFHGVGGEHSLNVALGEHRKLIQFLKQNEDKIWIAPLADIAQHVREYNQPPATPVKTTGK